MWRAIGASAVEAVMRVRSAAANHPAPRAAAQSLRTALVGVMAGVPQDASPDYSRELQYEPTKQRRMTLLFATLTRL